MILVNNTLFTVIFILAFLAVLDFVLTGARFVIVAHRRRHIDKFRRAYLSPAETAVDARQAAHK
jgi:hypothetical protein